MSSSSSSSSEEAEAEDHDSSESANEDAENDSSNDGSENEEDQSEDEQEDAAKSDTNTKKESQSKSLVDLDALEEEVVKLEEKMLPFSIFSKRKALDPLHDDLFAESEHEISHPIATMNDEMQDTDSHLDNLHENFAAIGAQLTDEAHHEKVVKQFEDDEDKDSDDEKDGDDDTSEQDTSKNNNGGEDKEVDDTPKSEEDIQASLAKMVRAHAGDDVLNSNEQDGNDEDDSNEDDDDALPASLPDFSNFKAEAERTLKKKGKRVSGESQLEQIMGGEKAPKRPPRKGGVKRNRTMPSRLGEEGNFFDWRKHAAEAKDSVQQQQQGQHVENASSSAEKSEGNTNNTATEQHSENASSNAEQIMEVTTNDATVEGAPSLVAIEDSSKEEDSNEEGTTHASTATGGGYLAAGAAKDDSKDAGTELTLDYGTYKSEARKKLDEEDGDDPTSGSSVLKILQDKKDGPPPPGSSELSLDYGTYKSEARKKLDDEDGDDPTSGSSVLKILQDKKEGVGDVSTAPSLLGDAAEKDSVGTIPKKRRGKGVQRNKTAPPGSMRRPGEAFFDWKKYAGDQGQDSSARE